jgi:hypothetical protein
MQIVPATTFLGSHHPFSKICPDLSLLEENMIEKKSKLVWQAFQLLQQN